MDRFSNNPFRSKFDPDSNNPLHIGSEFGCDLCEENKAVFESTKLHFLWCASCHPRVKEDHKLEDGDIDYV